MKRKPECQVKEGEIICFAKGITDGAIDFFSFAVVRFLYFFLLSLRYFFYLFIYFFDVPYCEKKMKKVNIISKQFNITRN